MNRKELIDEYKKRKIVGGVYKITNTLNGRYLVGHDANLNSARNRFEFAATTGQTFQSKRHPQFQKDWEAMGSQAFTYEVLEELEKGPEQNQADFWRI